MIGQILRSKRTIEKRKGIDLNVFAVANSLKVLLERKGIPKTWKTALEEKGVPYTYNDVIDYAKRNHLENLIAVDNTANETRIVSSPDGVGPDPTEPNDDFDNV